LQLCCKIWVELDGGQHFTDKGIKKDKQRDEYLEELGVRVLRIPDSDVFKNTEAVLKLIWESL